MFTRISIALKSHKITSLFHFSFSPCRLNGEEVASIFDQNHKDNHKNSMAGQTIIINAKRGDEIVVYAYTGTWLADFPMNHYTHWVGMLLKPSQEEIDTMRKEAMAGSGEDAPALTNGDAAPVENGN